MKQPNKGAADVHPDFRTRKQHLQIIAAKRRLQGESEAALYWISYCPRISKQAFKEA